MTELMIWDDRNWDLIEENAEYNGDFVIVRKLFVRVAVNVSKNSYEKSESELKLNPFFRQPNRIQSVPYAVKLKNLDEYRILK